MLSHVHTCYHSLGSNFFALVIQNRNSQIERLGQKLMNKITGGISKLDNPGKSPRPDSGRKTLCFPYFFVSTQNTEQVEVSAH